jgi:hypothetical protein
MKRVKNAEFIIMNFLATLLLSFLILNSTFIIPTFAQESTASSSVKEKLEELKQNIASKAAALKKEVTKQLENKAFMGVVKTTSDNSITIATKVGTKIASVNEDTTYEDQSSQKRRNFSLKEIEEEDNIAALGDVDDTGVLVARRIVLLPTTNSEPKTILWGQAISISDKIITIRDRSAKSISVTTTSDTTLEKDKKEIKFANLEINDYMIVTGYFDEKESTEKIGVLDAEFIYVITAIGATTPKESSPSASPSSSSKATPKSTPKVTPKATPKPTD